MGKQEDKKLLQWMWETLFDGGLGGEGCKDSEGNFMCEGPLTVECFWVNIWCMLDWISSQKCKDKRLLQAVDQQWEVQKMRCGLSI